ncbi:hypothetical protein [Reyranella sp. CPCC 100927]|uniref:hypothetical protein n=1 Tax=Reyranella sp. CPCC 100927 TaxID=2599616 RepID=UPI0011B79090|nr:hypothetical protein [Reyranella sp. CPCC 100927]TWT11384.1 hypothetical protein FQU96_12885 [Reyranella sp. CPCC 100927]
MIERIARAMYASEHLVNRATGQPLAWENLPPAVRLRWRKRSHAAIAAMREPEPAMIAATSAAVSTDGIGQLPPNATANDVWRAMIDAALRLEDKR